MRAAAVLLLSVALVVPLGGCTSRPDPAPSELIGESVAAAGKRVPPGRSYAWYDLSREVLGKEGSLIGGEAPDGEGGVIIAVCANGATIDASTKLSTGAIPEAGYRGDVKHRAEAGEYRALLPECASKK